MKVDRIQIAKNANDAIADATKYNTLNLNYRYVLTAEEIAK